MVRRLLLCLALCSPSAAGAPLDADTLAMVKAFIKVPTASLPPDSIERFISIDGAALPKELRRPYEAKKLELQTLRNISRSKKRGRMRSPEKDCEIPPENQNRQPGILLLAGFAEISDIEERFIIERSQCTEPQLLCEFSLTIAIEKKGKRKIRRYFLHENDPLFAYVGQSRNKGKKNEDSNFFGMSPPVCYR